MINNLKKAITITEQNWEEDLIPTLTVFNWVYNHKDFVRESIESILVQKTTFKVEIIIHDDASTDGTREIVLEYQKKHPNLFFNILQDKNQWSQRKSLVKPLYESAKGRYISLTHGDDYWNDPLKLQKQVDFLEANENYGLVHTDFLIYIDKLNKMENYVLKRNIESDGFYDLLTENNPIGTLTVCFRKQLFLDYYNEIKPDQQNWLLGDLPIWLFIAQKSKIHFINEITAVYRRRIESASNFQNIHKKINFEKSVCEVRLFFNQKFLFENLKTKKQIKFLFSINILRINLYNNGGGLQFISLLLDSFYSIDSIKELSIVFKLCSYKFVSYLKR